MVVIRQSVFASIAILVAGFASAQSFPTKAVRIIVPFPAGGGLDTTARAYAQKLGDFWNQTVVVENRPGASGMIGAESVVRAAKDGYTLLICSPPEDFATFIKAENTKYAKVIKDAGIKAD